MLQRCLAGALLALFLLPSLFIVYRALVPPEFSSLARMFATVLPGYLGTTLALSLLTGVLVLVFGVAGAFLVTFFRFPGRRFVDVALVLPLVLPAYLVAMVYREMSHRLAWSPAVESMGGAAAILGLTLYPYVYLLARTAFQRQAMGYIEIGKSLGLGRWRIATRALLPLALPAILFGLLLVSVEVISDYGTASILGVHTLTTTVHRVWFELYDPGLAAQLALFTAMLPLLLILAYALLTRGRAFVNPVNRPRPPTRSQLPPRAAWLALLFCLLPVIGGFFWPLAVLLYWAAQAFGRFALDSLYQELGQTLLIAIGTTVTAVLLGLWLSLISRWSHSRAWSLASISIISLGYATPAIVLAVSLLVLTGWSYETAVGGWLANSALLVMVATILRFTGFAYFSTESGLQSIPRQIDESVGCAGRSRFHGVTRLLIPMIRAPLTVGALLVFVMSAKELTLAVVLQPFGFKTLALSIYYFADVDVYQPAAIHALCLALVTLYPVLSINRWLSIR